MAANTWGQGIDCTKAWPRIPAHLSTVRCGSVIARWQERRAIIIQQRDIQLRRLALVTAAEVPAVIRQFEQHITKLNTRIDECNAAIDGLLVMAVAG